MAERRAPPGFRTPPHNIEVEQRTLGILLVNNDALSRVRDRLRTEHFYEPGHQALYEKTRSRVVNGRLADIEALSAGMDDAGKAAIQSIAQAYCTVPPEEIDQCTDELVRLWLRRKQIELSEVLTNASYDLDVSESEWRARVIEQLNQLEREAPQRRSKPCDLPAIDWARVAEEEPPPERWLVDQLVPLGTSGIITGPGAAGKSFLELMRLISMAIGRDFLSGPASPGFRIVEPIPCIGYFAEDSAERLWRYAKRICADFQIDPYQLAGRCEIMSTVGAHRHLITSEHNSPATTPTEWLHQVHDRARAMGARYIGFDHVGRYLAINRNDPNQVFSAFGHLDAMATSIDGSLGLLAHPSKTDIREKAKQGGKIMGYVGGCAAMIDAPRWVEVLENMKTSDGEKFRVLTNWKPTYSPKFAVKLVENTHGIVESVGEVDPEDPAGDGSGGGYTGRNSSRHGTRGPASNADRTFIALEEMFADHRREIALDELVQECVRRGIVTEAPENSNAWRDRRKLVRRHMNEKRSLVDIRVGALGECYAIKPQV